MDRSNLAAGGSIEDAPGSIERALARLPSDSEPCVVATFAVSPSDRLAFALPESGLCSVAARAFSLAGGREAAKSNALFSQRPPRKFLIPIARRYLYLTVTNKVHDAPFAAFDVGALGTVDPSLWAEGLFALAVLKMKLQWVYVSF